MSWSMTCVLPWTREDVPLVRAAIEEAIRACATKWPEYAQARVEVDRGSIHVFVPAALVRKPYWEVQPPEYPPDELGMYACTFRHYLIEPDPAHEYEGECGVSLDSNTSANRDAWMTASKLLEHITTTLRGTLRDF